MVGDAGGDEANGNESKRVPHARAKAGDEFVGIGIAKDSEWIANCRQLERWWWNEDKNALGRRKRKSVDRKGENPTQYLAQSG